MAGYGRVLTMNFSSPDSEFLLDSLKLLGFSGFLFSETFKALWHSRPEQAPTTGMVYAGAESLPVLA